jgi:hypothetical protein
VRSSLRARERDVEEERCASVGEERRFREVHDGSWRDALYGRILSLRVPPVLGCVQMWWPGPPELERGRHSTGPQR